MSEYVETKVTLSEALTDAARKRALIDFYTAKMGAMLQAVKDNPEYQSFELARAALATNLQETESRAKELALEAYRADGKKSRPGVTVKTMTKRSLIYDYNAAFKWAQAGAQELIVLDTKLFEKHALAVAKTVPVPCVQIIETSEETAQIASDLSGFLKE